jgi:replicative DNA helicase
MSVLPGCLPPQDTQAEIYLLTAMVNDPHCIDEIMPIVSEDDFYSYAHRLTYSAIVSLFTVGHPIDLVTIANQLQAGQKFADVGAAFLAELWQPGTTGADAHHHASIIRDKSLQRSLISLCTEIQRDCHSGYPGVDLLASLESRLHALSSRSASQEVTHIKPAVIAESDRLDTLGTEEGAMLGIPTGVAGLDEMMCGWLPGLYTIGARPSVGKTALMLTSALSAALHGSPALVISLEMPLPQIVRRDLSMLSGINLRRFRENRRLSPDEVSQITPALSQLMNLPLYSNRSMSMRIDHIQSLTRQCIRRYGVKIVFIDYLQLIEPSDRRATRVEQLESISRGLKMLSAQCEIPVVTLAQLNRGAAEDESKKPKLSDFRGSGSIEQDSDDCYMLWRISAEPQDDVWTYGLDIAKQRNGPIGELQLGFRRSCCRFEYPPASGIRNF